jgi:serralysin
VQGLDTFDFSTVREALTINLDQNGGTSAPTDDYTPEAKIICDSVIENVIGGRAADHITGNEFANTIKGGLGGDFLDGCGGGDTFVYTSTLQSKAGPGHLFDTIENFSSGEDFINLRAIDAIRTGGHTNDVNNDHFKIVSHFTGHAGELRITAGNVILGDVNGDGHADLKIVVHGDHVTHADLFL